MTFPLTPSPQTLERGKADLSIKSDGILKPASRSAAVAPAGPAPMMVILGLLVMGKDKII